MCILFRGTECSALAYCRGRRLLIDIFCGAALTWTMQAPKDNEEKEQEDTDGDRGIREIKDSETEADLWDAEEEKVNNVATMTRAIKQVAQRAPDDHPENKLIGQWAGTEHTQVEIHNDANGDGDKNYQKNIVCKQAEGSSIVSCVIEREILADERDKPSAIGRT